MANSYGAIDKDSNASPVSGVEGVSSNRKSTVSAALITVAAGLIVIGLFFGISSSPAEAPETVAPVVPVPDAVHWPESLFKIGGVDQFPANTDEAKGDPISKIGNVWKWTKSDEPCNPLLGQSWMVGGERASNTSVSLYFTPEAGDSPGVLSAIEVDYYGHVNEKLIGTYFSEEKTSKDGTYHSISLKLREGNMCEPAAPGNAPYLEIAPDMVALLVPTTEPEANDSFWAAGSCLAGMGYHWIHDLEGGSDLTWKAENMMPVVPMYSSEDQTISGVFFKANEKKQNWADDCPPLNPGDPSTFVCDPPNMWDPGAGLHEANLPPLFMCNNFCSEDCNWSAGPPVGNMFATMHFFFRKAAFGDFCGRPGPTPGVCRNGWSYFE